MELQNQMTALSERLPEYDATMEMFGVGKVLAPQLITEISDTRRFHSRKTITAFAELDAPPYQSGNIDVKSRSISKCGSPHLCKTLFQVIEFLKTVPKMNLFIDFPIRNAPNASHIRYNNGVTTSLCAFIMPK